MNRLTRIDFTRWTFTNFIVLALLGTLLRYMLNFSSGALNYLFILHAHSHFAFAGWIFMALAILLAQQHSQQKTPAFNWIMLLTVLSSYGMLASFSMLGYKAVSIIFSTLFLLLTYWFGYLIYPNTSSEKNGGISSKLIKASVWFLIISSVGPLALGILKATGNTGVVYQNAIYFYLHFQLNGWMLFAALALIAFSYLKSDASVQKSIHPWINGFILSTAPLFLLFTLWAQPPSWVFLIAFLGALLNAICWFVIAYKLRNSVGKLPVLIQIALLAISYKVVFQLLVCVPQIGDWTFSNRNLIIGYVHLITLGCVTPVIINQFSRGLPSFQSINQFYILLTGIYLCLLFVQPLLLLFQISIPYYQYCLLVVSVMFCIWSYWCYHKLSPFQSLFALKINTQTKFHESNI